MVTEFKKGLGFLKSKFKLTVFFITVFGILNGFSNKDSLLKIIKNSKFKIMFDFIEKNQEMIYVVILMIFCGIEIIEKVPSVLHTPLMSGANAIHGVVIIGAIIVMGKAEHDNYLALILGFFAVILGTLNVVGGFVVTDRMLEMFKKKK